jgi:hypothetical protein
MLSLSMEMALTDDGFFLCLACRKFGHQTLQCPAPGISDNSLDIYHGSSSSELCQRCSEINISNIVNADSVRDELEHWHFIGGFDRGKSSWDPGWKEHYKEVRFVLGPAPAIVLRAGCSLCRLIFAIFPRDIEEWSIVNNPEPWYLRPYPPYDRASRWNADVPLEVRAKYAVYFTVEQEHGEWRHRLESSTGPMQGTSLAFAPNMANYSGVKRLALAARDVGRDVDYVLLKSWIERCRTGHGVACRREWDDRVLSCRMIDVHQRQVIDCPPSCEYVALSYVWGGVQPDKDALEKGTLPQTIEDAITVTKGIGKRYLWVRLPQSYHQDTKLIFRLMLCVWISSYPSNKYNSYR